MAFNLIIRLKIHATAETPFNWQVFDNKKKLINSGFGNDSAFQNILPQISNIVVIVPALEILLTKVKLPKLSLDQLAKALPFELEDKLIENPQSLIFATGEFKPHKKLSVAVVSKEKMETWKNILKTHLGDTYRYVHAMIPDTLAFPLEPGYISVFIENNIAIVRTENQQGFSIEKENVVKLLSTIINKMKMKPSGIIFFGPLPPESFFSTEEINKLSIPIQHNKFSEPFISLMVESIEEPYPINLIHDVYSSKKRREILLSIMKISSSIVAIWLIATTLLLMTNILILRKDIHSVNMKMNEVYSTLYPNAPNKNNLYTKAKSELNALQATGSGSEFINLLKIANSGISNLIKAGLVIKSIKYHNKQLELDLQISNLTKVEEFRRSLESQGLKATLTNTSLSPNGIIETNLIIEEPNYKK